MSRRRRWPPPTAVALFAYLLGALLLTAAAWASPSTQWAGRCCDPEQSIWFLGWTPYALTHGLDPFFTTLIGAPAGVNIMWNTATPILGIVAWLPAQLGGPIFAYNVMLLGGIGLSGWTAYLALRRYARHEVGAFVGGAIYAFSPYVASHAELHLNLTNVWIPPLFVLVLDELLVRRRWAPWKLGVALGLLSVVQLLIAEEVLATSVIAAAVLVLVMAACRPKEVRTTLARLLPALATAAATFVIVGGWPLVAQFLGPQRLTGRVQDTNLFSTDLLNLVLPTPYQLISPAFATDISSHFSGLYHEATAYIGLPLLVLLCVVAVERWSDLRIRVTLSTALILFVLSLGAHLHLDATDSGVPLPWQLFGSLPLLVHVVPDRLTVYVWLAVAGVVAIVIDEAISVGRAGRGRLVGIAVALVFLLPVPLSRSSVAIPTFFRDWTGQGISAGETLLVAPLTANGTEAKPMLWSAVAGYDLRMVDAYALMPLPNGDTSAGPPSTVLTDVMRAIEHEGNAVVARGEVRAQIAADLRTAGIRHVIVGPMDSREALIAFFSDLFGRGPEDVGGVAIWRHVDVDGVRPADGRP